MANDKLAKTVEEAAYNHFLVFTQPIQAWPDELKEKLPDFKDLYLEPTPNGGVSQVRQMLQKLRRSPGPIKLLLTGQKGSGKSWTLRHMQEVLSAEGFRVIPVSATDAAGTTLADAEVSDLMVLLCEALAKEIPTWQSLSEADRALHRWIGQFKDIKGIPQAPDKTENFDINITFFWARFASRMRSDLATREAVRNVGADDLLIVVNELLKLLGNKIILLFDDLDKIDPSYAQKLFVSQYSMLANVRAKMVLTFPFSLYFGSTLPQEKTALRNIQVKSKQHATGIRPEALEQFTLLLGRLIDLSLVEGTGIEQAALYSGGIPREFGRILARAFELAALAEEPRVLADHITAARRDLRIELERATQDAERRRSLIQVHSKQQLETAMDRALLDQNMVIEYVNGHPWYDVHPLLGEVVVSWPHEPTA